MEQQNRKHTRANVFVRVRPFTDAEATICPEDSPLPREIVEWDGHRTLTVLDALNGFQPRKNGRFELDHVLWSFRDEERPKVVLHTQKDVYSSTVAPMIPQILDGYSTAFCVAGASGSGRIYSLYGDDVDGPNRGILPRFAENIFTAFQRDLGDNKLSCEVEAVDISPTDTYVDLLSQQRRRNTLGGQDDLKLVQDATEGMKLQGLTRVPVSKSSDLLSVLRQLARVVPKRSGCHIVHLRFMQTFEFADPEQMGQTVSKSRRVNVVFVLLRNMPAAFQRCIDVAVEHDSGENTLAKVPTRETAFTKLYPELLQQGYNLVFLCCVSPFYEHARDTFHTLTLATKLSKLKCRPKLIQDDALVELRLLADEVRNLNTEMVQQQESVQIVQAELNAREVELMKKEAVHNECNRKLQAANRKLELAKHALTFSRYRTKWHNKNFERLNHEKKKSMASVKAQKEQVEKNTKTLLEGKESVNARIQKMEKDVEAQEAINNDLQSAINLRDQRAEEMEKMKLFISSSKEDRRRIIETDSEEKLKASITSSALGRNIKEEKEKAEARCRKLEKEYAAVYAAEKGLREKEQIEADIKKLGDEIAATEVELWRLQSELDRPPPGCHCTLM